MMDGRARRKSSLSCSISLSATLCPRLPAATDAFIVAAIEPSRDLVLTVRAADGSTLVSWEFFLEPIEGRRTRLLVRGCVGAQWPGVGVGNPSPAPRPVERVYWLLTHMPRWMMIPVAMFGHGVMQARQLRGIKRRAEGAETLLANRKLC